MVAIFQPIPPPPVYQIAPRHGRELIRLATRRKISVNRSFRNIHCSRAAFSSLPPVTGPRERDSV